MFKIIISIAVAWGLPPGRTNFLDAGMLVAAAMRDLACSEEADKERLYGCTRGDNVDDRVPEAHKGKDDGGNVGEGNIVLIWMSERVETVGR